MKRCNGSKYNVSVSGYRPTYYSSYITGKHIFVRAYFRLIQIMHTGKLIRSTNPFDHGPSQKSSLPSLKEEKGLLNKRISGSQCAEFLVSSIYQRRRKEVMEKLKPWQPMWRIEFIPTWKPLGPTFSFHQQTWQYKLQEIQETHAAAFHLLRPSPCRFVEIGDFHQFCHRVPIPCRAFA